MIKDYSIRLANKNDLQRLAEIEILSAKRFAGLGLLDHSWHLLNESFSSEKLAHLIEKRQVWMACKENESVGFAIASVLGNKGYLEEIDVLIEHSRLGIGSSLIKTVCQWAHKSGFKSLLLSTFKSIAWNAPFTKSLDSASWILMTGLPIYMKFVSEKKNMDFLLTNVCL